MLRRRMQGFLPLYTDFFQESARVVRPLDGASEAGHKLLRRHSPGQVPFYDHGGIFPLRPKTEKSNRSKPFRQVGA
jgi:hypothetical protein